MKVAFTGHRPDKFGGWAPNDHWTRVYNRIGAALMEIRPSLVYSGMALGVDQWAAYAAKSLNIPFVAVIPFIGQEKAWPQTSQSEYDNLMKLASKIEVVGNTQDIRFFRERNKWLVNHCDLLIAVFDGSNGGTAHCVKYAQKISRPIRFIDPS